MKLLLLSIFSFFFITTSAFGLNKEAYPGNKVIVANDPSPSRINNLPPVPVLIKDDSFPILSAQAVLAVDVASGVALYEKNPDAVILPASTTKMVTALVALEYYPLDAVLKVDGVVVQGQRMGLYPGEEIKAKDLLYGLLIYSANDAAEVLAGNYCIDETRCGRNFFIQAMNEKAKELSLKNTYFKNPTGLEEAGHVSTARDLLWISEVAMKNEFFKKAVGIKKMTVESIDGTVAHKLTNINELLGEVEGVKGVKTGWTENARENLVSYVERDGRQIMTVVLGSQDRFGETKELIEWIFENYRWQKVYEPNYGLD